MRIILRKNCAEHGEGKKRVTRVSVMVDINLRKGPSERCVGWLFVDVDR